jgi:hypothetical protein
MIRFFLPPAAVISQLFARRPVSWLMPSGGRGSDGAALLLTSATRPFPVETVRYTNPIT